MLPIEQIISFIRHDDPLVVQLAFNCLEWVRWPSRLTGDFVLEAVQQGHVSLQKYLHQFETSPAVLKHATAAIRSKSFGANEFWPFGVIDRSRDALFTPQIVEELQDIRIPVKWVAGDLKLRLELMKLPTDRLREQFLAECDKAQRERSAMSEHRRIRALADRLVYRGDSIEWAREQLVRAAGSNNWEEIWLYALLIKAEDRSILPQAVERFRTTTPDDNEALFEELNTAMKELATPADVELLKSAWEHCVDDQRGGFAEAMSKLRFAEAEPLVLHIAKDTSDQTDRSYAAVGLCEMLATNEESIEFVRDLTERKDFDSSYADLEKWAIPLGIMLGRPFAEEAQWRSRLADPEELAARRKRFLGGEDSALYQLAQLLGTAGPAAPSTASKPAKPLSELSDQIQPLRSARTVGRNDPCPCGSGKKYKKCCGK
jgi:hypothetical protein